MNVTLSDSMWERISVLLANIEGISLNSSARDFIDSVLWILRTGAQWRSLKHKTNTANWNAIYKRFRRWSALCVFDKILETLRQDADFECICIDSTMIRAHMSAAGAPKSAGGQEAQSFGRSRGGFSTKIHIKVDALGLPLKMVLTPGQRGDMPGAWLLCQDSDVQATAVMCDTAYDSNDFRAYWSDLGVEAVIPSNPTRKKLIPHDKHLYKARHVVECFINKMKWYRRISTRYDKLDQTYLSFLHLAACLIWLR